MKGFSEEVFVCIDCETTGLDPKKDRVVEIAAATFTMDGIMESFESLIDPGCLIPEETIRIHHITDKMVAGQPKIEEVLPRVQQLIGNHPVVGHGVLFDLELVATALDRAGVVHTIRSNPIIDTLRMARMYGNSPSNSLEQLRNHFNIVAEGAHRAMNDVVVNIEVFKMLAKDFKNLKELRDKLSRPIAMRHMPLGKHKGRLMKEVPLDYLLWAANKDFDQDLLYSIRSEINRRKKGGSFSQASNPFGALTD